ncbi:cytochrome b/b6 domain-containing protein [Halopseudomonas pelagia]|uniref:cytochrome b/b6 domain-containing protein n=1 Tax=Halopseudomonas pelagia TaxID=553151 RepID=UPI0030DADEE8|tara:strand:- start:69471 stop:70115 length:645 start_codon:yes stop_codon:yes gene_type:complete
MQITVWDIPTRLFHWLLVLAISGSLITAQLGWTLWHGRFGLTVFGLLVFRLLWGLLGNHYARFASFFPTPGRISAYLKGRWTGPGHNPLGALSVFALLVLLGSQALSGLFSSDDVAFSGPLAWQVPSWVVGLASDWHRGTELFIYLLLGLHVLAVLFYQYRGQQILGSMIHGQRRVTQATAPTRPAGAGALTLALLLTALAVWAASGAWITPLA